MKRFTLSLIAGFAVLAGASAATAQVPYISYYQPSTVYYAPTGVTYSTPTVTYSRPTSYLPTTTYYAPTTTYYAPTTRYYAPASTYVGPSSPYYSYPTVSRYRPLLGTTVSRYVTGYAPSVVYSY